MALFKHSTFVPASSIWQAVHAGEGQIIDSINALRIYLITYILLFICGRLRDLGTSRVTGNVFRRKLKDRALGGGGGGAEGGEIECTFWFFKHLFHEKG